MLISTGNVARPKALAPHWVPAFLPAFVGRGRGGEVGGWGVRDELGARGRQGEVESGHSTMRG